MPQPFATINLHLQSKIVRALNIEDNDAIDLDIDEQNDREVLPLLRATIHFRVSSQIDIELSFLPD
jgi:hypothetical protein